MGWLSRLFGAKPPAIEHAQGVYRAKKLGIPSPLDPVVSDTPSAALSAEEYYDLAHTNIATGRQLQNPRTMAGTGVAFDSLSGNTAYVSGATGVWSPDVSGSRGWAVSGMVYCWNNVVAVTGTALCYVKSRF